MTAALVAIVIPCMASQLGLAAATGFGNGRLSLGTATMEGSGSLMAANSW